MNLYVPKNEADFPGLAQVKALVRENRTRLPYILEFSGLPKSGKTTIMRRTVRGLDRLGVRCSTITEAATTKVDRSLRSDLFVFNMLCYFENLRSVVSESQRRESIDVVLVDRGIVDSFVWFEFLKRIGLLQDDLRKRIEDFAALPAWLAQVNHVVYIKSDWRSYRARFRLDSPVEEEPTLSQEYFDHLAEAYDHIFSNRLNGIRIQTIDGGLATRLNAEEVSTPDILRDNWVTAHNASFEIITKAFKGIVEDHVEYIATLPKRDVDDSEINALRGEKITEFIDRIFADKIAYKERQGVEKDATLVQIIAGAFVKRDGQLLILKHAETEKRADLKGKWSILVTGHVEKLDKSLTCGARNAVENCLFRELKEELTSIDWPKVSPRYAIRIGKTEMGRLHLAFIYEIQSISRALGISRLAGAGDFEPDPRFWSLKEAVEKIDDFDEWSQQILRWLAKEELDKS